MTIDDMLADAITHDVRRAIEFAVAKHGLLTRDYGRAAVILTEEVGEVAREVLMMTHRHATPVQFENRRIGAISELSQVAAVAIMMIANLKAEPEKVA